MSDGGMLLTPKGQEVMEQEEEERAPPPAPAEGGRRSDGKMVGVPVQGGAYMRYSFYGITFEVSSRYVPPINPIGKGAFGIVCSAVDSKTGEEVAIKKIGNAFNDRTDAKRTLREILLLRHLSHPNVIAVKDVIRPPRPQSFRDVYIVYDLMPIDLHEVIRSGQAMDDKHYKFILYQLLRGLKYIHSANVLHRDLKPPNILIDGRCNVKITDFGLARTALGLEDHMTEYVVTRYYRAPELLLNSADYTGAIDVWSVGCVYMELVTGKILLEGDNYVDQLRRAMKLVGTPLADDLDWLHSEDTKKFLLSIPREPKKNLMELFPKLVPEAADLVDKMLAFDPKKRITVTEALEHPYLAQYHDPANEPVHAVPFKYDLSFEQEEYTIARVRQLIYEQACSFDPPPASS
eukprot:TRINITY_DN6876_c0_g1_i1.p1 TRINITY_DN6876_c0_g1~~TRINITY_DN6876_c0_g1_i1.p1  ORF type:complete len:405 (+),score=94.83 TRINITY_DN6876_c0_g1_i1:156-1370(+)